MQPSASPLRTSWDMGSVLPSGSVGLPPRYRSDLDHADRADRTSGAAHELEREPDIEEALADHAFEIGEVLGVEDSAVSAGAMGWEGRIGVERHRHTVVDTCA